MNTLNVFSDNKSTIPERVNILCSITMVGPLLKSPKKYYQINYTLDICDGGILMYSEKLPDFSLRYPELVTSTFYISTITTQDLILIKSLCDGENINICDGENINICDGKNINICDGETINNMVVSTATGQQVDPKNTDFPINIFNLVNSTKSIIIKNKNNMPLQYSVTYCPILQFNKEEHKFAKTPLSIIYQLYQMKKN